MIRLAAVLLWLSMPAFAQQAAEAAMAQLNAARVQLEQAETASDRISALTETVRAYEAGLSALREGQRAIALQEADLAQDLNRQRAEMAKLLGVLTNISRTPQPVQQAHPAGPLATLRAGMMVADLTPALQAEADKIAQLLSDVRAARAAQDAAAQALNDGLTGAQTARAALGQAMSERSTLPTRFVDDPVQTTLMVASAETLGAFASQLAGMRPDATATLTPQGNLPLPVGGRVLPDDGSGRPGVRIAAPPRALVTTPVAATVLFQGPLLDYGTVVILEPAADTLFVLAGLEVVFVQAGEVVGPDAPIGLLGDAQGYDDGILTENLGAGTGRRAQSLYLEVRDGQSPVNTDAWFALE